MSHEVSITQHIIGTAGKINKRFNRMKGSLRYKICLWMVWVQLALVPIVFLMIWAVEGNTYVWRWNLLAWFMLAGYLIGFIILPLSRGLDKSKLLKWWLRIDFVATILLFPIFVFTFAGSRVLYIAKKDSYVLYRVGGFLAAPTIYLGENDGLFIKEIRRFEGFGFVDSVLDWTVDTPNGYCKIHTRNLSGSIINVFPIDSALYHQHQSVVANRIDSLFHTRCDNDERMIFVMPKDFSVIEYGDSSWIRVSCENSQDIELQYREWVSKNVLDSILVSIHTTNYYDKDSLRVESYEIKDLMKLPKDSVPWMSPTEAHQFINDWKRRNGL